MSLKINSANAKVIAFSQGHKVQGARRTDHGQLTYENFIYFPLSVANAASNFSLTACDISAASSKNSAVFSLPFAFAFSAQFL